MPVDFQQIFTKIKEIGAGARDRRERIETLRVHARHLLAEHANDLDFLHLVVERAKETDPGIRCAAPLNEPINAHFPAPAPTVDATLIAADGSQINPDRHAAMQFCLVNVGGLTMRLKSGTSPDIFTESELLYGDELETRFGTMTDGMVALKRDLRERATLEELASQVHGPVVAFTDGPIELWGAREGEEAEAYGESLKAYLSVLSRLQERGVINAGYVDKPSADMVVRLLELIEYLGEENPPGLREYHPLRGVSDRWLYGEKSHPLLGPGERSAVFHIHSKSEKDYQGPLSLHFFYLNVGTDRHPWPVRVEIPSWVAEDAEKLNLLHGVLVDQCRMMGSKPYPYLLHRAHEVAVVKQEEKFQVEQMLMQELRRQDEEVDEGSNKQSAKDLPGRMRR